MKDVRLAGALLTSSPDALAELFDAYGDRLFRYCWSMLRSREMAQVALRDTLLVAQAHIARLADAEDPESLGPWLYSLARAECRRHQAVPAAGADESPAQLGLPAADARLMSWQAAMSLDAGAPALTPQDRAEVLAVLAGQQPPAAPALAQAALVPAQAALVPAPSAPPQPAPAPPQPAPAPAAAVPVPVRSALGPSLASYVRVPEPPAGVPVAPAPARPAPARPAPARPALVRPAVSALSASSAPAPAAASPSPTGAPRPRRVHRGRLAMAGAGALVSAVVTASAIVMAGAGTHGAAGSVTPALAAGATTGPASRAAGPGAAGPVSSRARSDTGAGRPPGTRLSTPPPLVSAAGTKNQVMITAVGQPLPPGRAPEAWPGGGGAGVTAAAPGELQLSAGEVILGTGSAGQITLTAAGGTVSWSASASPPDQVSLSSYGGTLQAGPGITVTVQVSRGAGAGSAAISFQVPGSDPLVVPVSWSAQPEGSGSAQPSSPGPSPSSRTSSSSPSPSSGAPSGTPTPTPSS